MLEAVDIEGFRGIARGTIAGLSRLNLLVGPNNSGKSTCLEALLLGSASTSSSSIPSLEFVASRRGAFGDAG